MTKPKYRPLRYAEGTKVPVTQSKADVETLLRNHGASSIASMWDARVGGRLVFRLGAGKESRMVRFDVAPVTSGNSDAIAKEERRRWRALLLRLKAHLETVTTGEATIEQEFLGYLLLPDGQTVSEKVAGEIASAYETGVSPALYLGTGE